VRLLLDTHVFLWWRADAPELGRAARAAIGDAGNEVFVSAAVGWEIVIKRALGRLDFDGAVAAAVAEEGFAALPIAVSHVDEVARLPEHHRDPFDRLLVAQARVESLTLVTADPLVRRYAGIALLDA
jgi:PIN domain nuclease of toxin-antitoxin system